MFSNNDMYQTFVHYLQLDKPGPIPYHLRNIIFPKNQNHMINI